MSEEVVKWLAEIRTLKQELGQAHQERDEANQNEAKWRQLYSTEAQQRRTEARLAQEQIEQLKAEIQQLQAGIKLSKIDSPESAAAIEKEIAELNTESELKDKLAEVMKERDRALDALKAEQEQHAHSRKSLTAVISDTIDQLARVRGGK
jgi:uncharacterized phage infection (PIP) family protein YhgE